MSYSAEISFKTIEGDKLFSFFNAIKQRMGEEMESFAKDNFLFMPSVRYCITDEHEAWKANKEWAEKAFRWRWFYLEEHKLLGVFGVPNCAKSLFDATCYFQNSCDQDYEFGDWKGVPAFEQIATKWQNCPVADVQKAYDEEIGSDLGGKTIETDSEVARWRRSMCYREIWDMISHFLFDEETVVYLSLYGFYDVMRINSFVGLCKKAYDEWVAEFEEKENESKGEK